MDVIVSPSYIEFRKEALSPEIFQCFSDIRERVVVVDCPLVYLSIIHDNVLFFRILFVDEIDWGSIRGWSFLDSAQL